MFYRYGDDGGKGGDYFPFVFSQDVAALVMTYPLFLR
jgi:hypothetical protein